LEENLINTKIYKNGDIFLENLESIGNFSELLPVPSTNKRWSVGGWGMGVNTEAFLFTGHIDEFRIWDIIRTPEEIRANMYRELENPELESNLLFYFNFNEFNEYNNPIDLSINSHTIRAKGLLSYLPYNTVFPYHAAPWLSILPVSSNEIIGGEYVSLGLEYRTNYLTIGQYLSDILVTSSTMINSELTIPTTLNVIDAIQLEIGPNLISFYTEFVDPSVSMVLSELENNVNAVIGEGLIATLINGEWGGNLTEFDVKGGYWIIMNNNDNLLVVGNPITEEITYNLHNGANLISYPFDTAQGVLDALPDDIESDIIAIIGEGTALIPNPQIPGSWFGTLTALEPKIGYWLIIDVEEDITMVYNPPSGVPFQITLLPEVIADFKYNSSLGQAFYFIDNAKINGVPIVSEDWIIAYKNDTPIGARKWIGSNSDVPVMGDDGFGWTDGYIETGEIPIFKIYDASEDIYYTCVPSGVENGLDWDINKIVKIGTLAGYIMGCTDNTALNYNPSATYDNSSCVYILGDVDNDGSITVIDLTLIVDIIIEELTPSEYQLFAGDFIQDGTINILDVVEMVDYLLDRVDYYLPPGTVIVTKVIKQVGSPPFVMDVSMSNTTTVTGLQLEIELDPGYKALSCNNGTYSSNMTQAYKFNNDSSIVKLVFYGPLGEEISPGNGIIANIGMEYVGTARGVHDPESGSVVGLIAANGGEDALESDVVSYDEFVRSVGGEEVLVPEEFALHAAYPNPFNPITTIKFDLPEDVSVSLIVYDLMGRQITKLVNESMNAGYHSVQWNATSTASGIYLVKLVAGEFTQTQKIALVK